jgi:RNA-directed DNA polymerase
MYERGKSDGCVVPAKPANKAATAVAELVEERHPAKGNTDRETHPGRRAGMGVSRGLDRVREVAVRDKQVRFTALMHHITLDRLRWAYWAISPKAAPGTDGVTWRAYRQDLEANLADLHQRVHRGSFRATPSRRVYIPKADGRLRPLGIAALEDKIVQRAVVEVLNAVFETDFRNFSYGFRPQRGPHDALDALAVGIERRKVNWVLDADIRDFFTNVDRDWLRKFLRHRIADERLLRLVGKWLAAGVVEEGVWSEGQGTPQGASISPLLANVYLHHVLDLWVDWWRRHHARGEVIIVRFADDFICGFQHRADAQRFLVYLRQRMAKFGLELHPDKTRLIEFGRFAADNRVSRGLGKPETFDFLGFTHICGTSRNGRFKLKRVTIAKRMRMALVRIKDELKRRMHQPIPQLGRWLASVVRGHMAYYAVPDNGQAVGAFLKQVTRLWLKTLRRRSQRTMITWARMSRLEIRWLPKVRIMHPYPNVRLDAKTQGRSPVR